MERAGDVRIGIAFDRIEPPSGTVRGDAVETCELQFVGWLGLIGALEAVLAEVRPPRGSGEKP